MELGEDARATVPETVAREFDLGRVYESHALPGRPDVLRVRCSAGEFMIKKPWDLLDVELYSRVEVRLNDLGIRQARQLRTTSGSLVAGTGHAVQEWLPGEILVHPEPDLTRRFLTHLAAYDSALAGVEVPPELAARDSVWTRVVRPDYLLAELPGLLARHPDLGLDPAPVDRLLDALSDGQALLTPTADRQLVHGDHGPDNVLLDRDGTLTIIDFTPYHDSVLLGLGSVVYFFALHGRNPDRAELEAAFAAYGAESEAGWATLTREALRRLATPFAAAAARGTALDEPATLRRYCSAVTLADLVG
ncbi:phosphotransferase [Microlunatus sp. GCM10028923]|uniref:phosphotransferase n=1 Tax=Microlunatus sp. GCM10028923 TaxID=3273400 RepID=UPI00360F4440